MKKQLIRTISIVLLSFTSLLGADDLKITKNKENVLSSKIAGSWVINKELTIKLYGSDRVAGENALSKVTFTVDDDVFTQFLKKNKVSEMTKEEKSQMPIIYQSGWMTFADHKCPYLLMERNGNPTVLFFLEKNGDIFGNGESFIVMLAGAKDKKNDALFIGGDFNNQPFRAYSRTKLENN